MTTPTKLPRRLNEARDELALNTWIKLTKQINPTDRWEKDEFIKFLTQGNRSQTYEATQLGFDAAVALMLKEVVGPMRGALNTIDEAYGSPANTHLEALISGVLAKVNEWIE